MKFAFNVSPDERWLLGKIESDKQNGIPQSNDTIQELKSLLFVKRQVIRYFPTISQMDKYASDRVTRAIWAMLYMTSSSTLNALLSWIKIQYNFYMSDIRTGCCKIRNTCSKHIFLKYDFSKNEPDIILQNQDKNLEVTLDTFCNCAIICQKLLLMGENKEAALVSDEVIKHFPNYKEYFNKIWLDPDLSKYIHVDIEKKRWDIAQDVNKSLKANILRNITGTIYMKV